MISTSVPNRSAYGCLTCKQRKKKCDETKPTCNRCRDGGFDCLGYDHLKLPKKNSLTRRYNNNTTVAAVASATFSRCGPIVYTNSAPEITLVDDVAIWRQTVQPTRPIPRGVVMDAIEPQSLSSLVVSQFGRHGSKVIFGPFSFRLESALARLVDQSPEVKRWSLYLGANLFRGLLEGNYPPNYIPLIDRFQRQVVSSAVAQNLNLPELEGRLSCLGDLAYYTAMLLDTRASYLIFKQCLPFFLRLASENPDLWASGSAISIYRVLNSRTVSFEMRKFVLWDTISSVAFGIAPLLHYDTTFRDLPQNNDDIKMLERSYGCPRDIIVLLAKISSWRVSIWDKWADKRPGEWTEIEDRLKRWTPGIDPDLSSNLIGRFAVLESWRQATFIYLYMGMCSANSSDPRVESAVHQIFQLSNTVKPGNPLEIHFCMPCLIAGIAARRELHRASMRKRTDVSRDESVWCLRAADFVAVLDHLWQGVGAGGAPVTWEDYVSSRGIMLPIGG